MNEEAMRKHYERTPKETLINILISSREKVDKLQNRNKERKQEIERLNNIIKKAIEYMDRRDLEWGSDEHDKMMDILKGSNEE